MKIAILINFLLHRELVRRFKASRRTQKDKMEAKCCIHEPLLNADDDIDILDLIMIPELHLHIGIVNKLLQVLNEKWGSDEVYIWLALKHIKSEKFYNRVSSKVELISEPILTNIVKLFHSNI